MSSKTLALIMTIVGLLIAVFFAFADMTGVGNPARFGSRQIGGTVVGALVFIVGLVIYLRQRRT
ncbi:MAG: hypothetical protein ACREOI_22855 [bacterium]